MDALPDESYRPPVILDDLIDGYVDYINLLSAAILLRRDDLIPRIYGLIEGTDYDGEDLIIETLFGFFLPDRPAIDEWFWEHPYSMLVEVLDSQIPSERQKAMKRYVAGWYRAMKGQAHFWGKHEKVELDFSPYLGYWAMCAGAVSFLYEIDDAGYRDELVYPKDLVDYARSMPAGAALPEDEKRLLRVAGGQPCPEDGTWFSPAKMDSARHFKAGEIMPSFDASEYGATIWQWIPPANP